MEYPSFVWDKGIAENRARCPIVRGNVLNDLKIGKLFPSEGQKNALIPCNGSEIRRRQALFDALEKEPAAEEALFLLRDAVLQYKKKVAAFRISETEREKTIYFAVMVSSYLEITSLLADLSVYGEVFSPVSEFFQVFLRDPFAKSLASDTKLKNRRGYRCGVRKRYAHPKEICGMV